jgi:hypothetical protein
MALDHVNPQRDRPIHLSFDVDALDPSVAPSTGTPVSTFDLLSFPAVTAVARIFEHTRENGAIVQAMPPSFWCGWAKKSVPCWMCYSSEKWSLCETYPDPGWVETALEYSNCVFWEVLAENLQTLL